MCCVLRDETENRVREWVNPLFRLVALRLTELVERVLWKNLSPRCSLMMVN